LKVDNRGRLFVAGGSAGTGRVIDARTGELLSEYHFAETPTFVNDVVLTRSTVWFTDSARPQLYGLPLGRNGSLPDQSQVVTLPLEGAWEQMPGNNANGIVQTPDHRALIVVQTATGLLFRVDPSTGVATKINLGSTLSLPNGDGLLLEGRTLYVVQNRDNQVAVVKLNRSGTTGQLVDTLTSRDFDVPTTVASFGNSLYLPNARFRPTGTPPPEEFWITRIDKPRGR
jgi:sugar lactone lactonase YvrE